MKFFCTFVLLILFIQSSLATNAPESRGIDFYVAFGYNYQAGLGQTQTLFISSAIANNIVVSTRTTTITTVSVNAGQTVSVDVSSIYITSENTVGDFGIRVHSTTSTVFTLVGLNSYPATTDAFLAFPLNVLGTSYIAAGYTGCCGVPGYLYVVATQDGTNVQISNPLGHVLDGQSTTTATFNGMLGLQAVLVGSNGGDITGFSVQSNFPVALFGGAACADIPSNVQACNVLVDQIPPINTWDSDFLTVPIPTRTAGDVFRVISSQPNTAVFLNGAQIATLNAGYFYEYQSGTPNIIHTSNPALLMQYDKGSSADGASADPFQIWIPPVSQYAGNYFITTPTASSWTNWISITIQSGAQSGLFIDGNPVTSTFNSIPGSINGISYVYTEFAVSGGSHNVYHSSIIQNFEVVVYGFGSYDGYGYVGGNRLAPLQDPCTPTPTVPGDGIDNDCDGRIDEEIRNHIDDDGDGLIDEDLTVDTCCYTNTILPSFSVNGSLSSVTINCGDNLPSTPFVVVSYACDSGSTSSVLTPTVTTTPGACNQGSEVTRVWSYTDTCGNIATLTQVITINAPTSVTSGDVTTSFPVLSTGGQVQYTYCVSDMDCSNGQGICEPNRYCSCLSGYGGNGSCDTPPIYGSCPYPVLEETLTNFKPVFTFSLENDVATLTVTVPLDQPRFVNPGIDHSVVGPTVIYSTDTVIVWNEYEFASCNYPMPSLWVHPQSTEGACFDFYSLTLPWPQMVQCGFSFTSEAGDDSTYTISAVVDVTRNYVVPVDGGNSIVSRTQLVSHEIDVIIPLFVQVSTNITVFSSGGSSSSNTQSTAGSSTASSGLSTASSGLSTAGTGSTGNLQVEAAITLVEYLQSQSEWEIQILIISYGPYQLDSLNLYAYGPSSGLALLGSSSYNYVSGCGSEDQSCSQLFTFFVAECSAVNITLKMVTYAICNQGASGCDPSVVGEQITLFAEITTTDSCPIVDTIHVTESSLTAFSDEAATVQQNTFTNSDIAYFTADIQATDAVILDRELVNVCVSVNGGYCFAVNYVNINSPSNTQDPAFSIDLSEISYDSSSDELNVAAFVFIEWDDGIGKRNTQTMKISAGTIVHVVGKQPDTPSNGGSENVAANSGSSIVPSLFILALSFFFLF